MSDKKSSARSAATSESYYYANGVKIPLAPSSISSHSALKEKMPAGDSPRPCRRHRQICRTRYRFSTCPSTTSSCFKLPDNGSGAAAARALGAADAASAATTRVYEPATAENGGPHEALIDVGEVVVKFVEKVDERDRRELLRRHNLEIVTDDYPEPDAVVAKTTQDAASSLDSANGIHREPDVEYAAPNFVHIDARLSVTDDTMAIKQILDGSTTALDSPDTVAVDAQSDPALNQQWGLTKIRAQEAWAINDGDPQITIAIVDEGGAQHEDYVVAPGWDALNNDADPTPLAADGHGTACAGIAAATRNNGRGGAGVAPRCKVRHIRIARGVGGGSWFTTDAIVAAGIRKAVDLGADVLSNSYRLAPSTAVTNALGYAQTGRAGRGLPMAAATANEDVLGVRFPASLSPNIKGLMAVGASNQWDQRKSKTSLDGETWWGSNYGPEVDVVAPGVKIHTTDIMGAGGYTDGNYVPTFNGTSSATPHVAGLMGLILSVDRDLRGWEVEDIIKLTARELGPAGRDNEFGFGRIDARKALRGGLEGMVRDRDHPGLHRCRQGMLHPREHPHLQPGHQHDPAEQSGLPIARSRRRRVGSFRVPAGHRRCDGAANDAGRAPRRGTSPSRRHGGELVLPLHGQLGVYVLAAERPGFPARPAGRGSAGYRAARSGHGRLRGLGRRARRQRAGGTRAANESGNGSAIASNGDGTRQDTVRIDRQTREVTVVIR